MNMERVFGKARSLWALTSLDRVELARLEEGPGEAPGQRTGPGGGTTACHASGRCGADGPGKLPTTRARLLFLLFCFKCYPLQEVLAFLFGICGIKRCHGVADLFRDRRPGFVDDVMLASSGLHNLRLATRTMAA